MCGKIVVEFLSWFILENGLYTTFLEVIVSGNEQVWDTQSLKTYKVNHKCYLEVLVFKLYSRSKLKNTAKTYDFYNNINNNVLLINRNSFSESFFEHVQIENDL